jgi:hypothetical protein
MGLRSNSSFRLRRMDFIFVSGTAGRDSLLGLHTCYKLERVTLSFQELMHRVVVKPVAFDNLHFK